MGYCLLKEDMNFVHKFGPFPELKEEHSFLSGKWIDLTIDTPIVCEVDCEQDESPCHFIDDIAPIFSGQLLEQLTLVGIDNFQAFPVVLKNSKLGLTWDNYFAINVLGLIDSIDTNLSASDEIMPGDVDDGIAELVHFEKIVIDSNKTHGALMFRELRSPDVIIFDACLIDSLKANRPSDGWKLRVKML